MAQIDVWMPVRDASSTLAAALSSLERQRYGDWRLIAADDGSRDGSAELLDRFASRRPGTRVVRCAGQGIVQALLACAAASDAPLVARMDADDLMHRDRLQLQIGAVGRADVVASRVRLLGGLGSGMRAYAAWLNTLESHDDVLRNLFVESPLAHPTVLIRREAYERAGGYRDAGWAEDYDLWLRCWTAGATFSVVPRRLLAWRDRPDRLTRTHPRYSPAAFRRAKLAYLLRHPVLASRNAVVWGAGQAGRRWIRDLHTLGVAIPCAIDIDPDKVGRRIQGTVKVVDPETGLADPRRPVLVAVASRGAREIIRRRLDGHGRREGVDWLALA